MKKTSLAIVINLQYETLELEVRPIEEELSQAEETFRQISGTGIIIATPSWFMPNYEMITTLSWQATIGTMINPEDTNGKEI